MNTERFICFHSTSQSKLSATARSGTSVLASTITGATSRYFGLPFTNMVLEFTTRFTVVPSFSAFTLFVCTSQVTMLPKASNIVRTGTMVLPSMMMGETSKLKGASFK